MLDKINFPKDLKKLNIADLLILCEETKHILIDTITKIGGHLGASLGIIELTTALHYVFDAPDDKIIWDIGHQAYVHKIFTGRKDKLSTIRKTGGLSGFCSIFESEYDCFGAGHSSTSVSAALGFLEANKLQKKDNWIIAIIGDGAMSAGMAFEALNNIPKDGKMLIILNDNQMSIDPTVGNLTNHFANINSENNIFTNLGLHYIGVNDGHNLAELISNLEFIKDNLDKPLVLHIKTIKGRGYQKNDINCAHSISLTQAEGISYNKVVGDVLHQILENNKKVCIVTPAMISGSGLSYLAKSFGDRVFDVGIAEQHAITFCAGLVANGMIAFCSIYSTFLQRSYDQIIHDVAIQNLPVRFLIDRAGFVGQDGVTHHGSFDISMLISLPNFVIMAPSGGLELNKMINTAININDQPSAIRYPKTVIPENTIDITNEVLEIGKGNFIKNGKQIAVLSFGDTLGCVIEADKILQNHNIDITIFDLRFAKPIDVKSITEIAQTHSIIISIEDGGFGGIGMAILETLNNIRYKGYFKALHHSCEKFIEHASIEEQKRQAGIDSKEIIDLILNKNFSKDYI